MSFRMFACCKNVLHLGLLSLITTHTLFHTYIKRLSGAVAPSHCSRCCYRTSALEGIQTRWKQTRPDRSRSQPRHSILILGRWRSKSHKKQILRVEECKNTLVGNILFLREILEIINVFVSDWRASLFCHNYGEEVADLNCFIDMLKGAVLMKKWEQFEQIPLGAAWTSVYTATQPPHTRNWPMDVTIVAQRGKRAGGGEGRREVSDVCFEIHSCHTSPILAHFD